MSSDEAKGEGGGLKLAKGVLMGLGALVALGLVVSVLKPLILVGMAAGAGYLGYRLLARNKALGGGEGRRALKPGADDYDSKMRELEEIERRLDSEIKR